MATNTDLESTMTLAVRFTATTDDKTFKSAIAKLQKAVSDANKLVEKIGSAATAAPADSIASQAIKKIKDAMSGQGSVVKQAGAQLIDYNKTIDAMTDRTEAYRKSLKTLAKQYRDPDLVKGRPMIDKTVFDKLTKDTNNAEQALIKYGQATDASGKAARNELSTRQLLNEVRKRSQTLDSAATVESKKSAEQSATIQKRDMELARQRGGIITAAQQRDLEMAKMRGEQLSIAQKRDLEMAQQRGREMTDEQRLKDLRKSRVNEVKEYVKQLKYQNQAHQESEKINTVLDRQAKSYLASIRSNQASGFAAFKRGVGEQISDIKLRTDAQVSNIQWDKKAAEQLDKTATAFKNKYIQNEDWQKHVDTVRKGFAGSAGELSKQLKMDEVPVKRLKAYNAALDYASEKYPQHADRLKSLHGEYLTGGKSVEAFNGALAREIHALNNLVPHQSKLALAVGDLIGKAKILASYALAGGLIYSVFGGVRAAGREIAAYDQVLKNLQAITGATDEETRAMGETIKKVATETRFSTKEIGDGMTLIGQAGFNASQSIQIIGSAAELSTGTLEKMDITVDLLTTTLAAFGLKATESSRVSDVMANAINKSKLTVDKLRVSFGYFGSLAHEAGINLEETAASMSILADHGLRASTIGTSLRQVVSRLIEPNDALRKATGYNADSLKRLNPLTAGWSGTLKELSIVLWDNKKQVMDVGKAFEIFGLRGAQAAVLMAKAYKSGEYAEYLESLYLVGAAHKMAVIQMEGIEMKAKNLGNTWKTLAIELSEIGSRGVMGVILDSLKALGDLLIWITKDGITKFVLQAGFWAAAFYGLVAAVKALLMVLDFSAVLMGLRLAFLSLGGSVTEMAVAFSALNTVLFSNPWIWVAIGIGLVVAALFKLKDAEKEAAQAAEDAALKSKAIAESFQQAANQMEEVAKTGLDTYESHLQLNTILDRLETQWPQYMAVLEAVRGKYQDLILTVRELSAEEAKRAGMNTQEVIMQGFKENRNAKTVAEQSAGSGLTGLPPDLAAGGYIGTWIQDLMFGKTTEEIKLKEQDLDNKFAGYKKQIVDYFKGDAGLTSPEAMLNMTLGGKSYREALEQKVRDKYPMAVPKDLGAEDAAKYVAGYEKTINDATTGILQSIKGTAEQKDLEDNLKNAQKVLREAKSRKSTAEQAAELEASRGDKTNTARQLELELKTLEKEKEVARAQYEVDKLQIGSKKEMTEDKADWSLAEKEKEIDNKMAVIRNKLTNEGVIATQRLKTANDELADTTRELREAQRNSWKELPTLIKAAEEDLRKLKLREEELIGLVKAKPHEKIFVDELRANRQNQLGKVKDIDKMQRGYSEAFQSNDPTVIAAQNKLLDKQLEFAAISSKGPMSLQNQKNMQEELVRLELELLDARIAANKGVDVSGFSDDEKIRVREKLLELENKKTDVVQQQAKLGTEWSRTWKDLGKSAFDQMEAGFANVISKSKTAQEAMEDFAQTMLNLLAELIVKLTLMSVLWATIGQTKKGSEILGALDIKDIWGTGFGAISGASGGGVPKASRAFDASGFPGVNKLAYLKNMSGGFNVPSRMKGLNPEFATAGGGMTTYQLFINATDAQSFSRMLATEPAQKMVSQVVTNKFVHNDSIRKTLRR